MRFPNLAGPLSIAVAVLAATLATLAPDGNGPGVTCDELYHVYQGKRLVTALRQQGFAFFLPANIEGNFPWKAGGPPVQAPLGYWILGWTHYLFDPAPDDPNVVSIPAARFAPAIAFALLVLMVGIWTGRREGPLAGTVAAAAVALMPRLFGHAHLAALDMLTTLFFVAAVLAVAEAARGDRLWQYAIAGMFWGATTLVRLHGLLLAPPIIAWLIWRSFVARPNGRQTACGFAAVNRLATWLLAGGATFFAGWPWLWLAPIARFRQYLASGTDRQMLHVFYMGQVWNDRAVPWHYPWVMFAVTVPVGLLALGALGIWVQWRRSRGRQTAKDSENAKCKLQIANCKLSVSYPQSPIPNPSFPRPHPNPLPRGEGTLLGGVMLFVLLVFSFHVAPAYDGVRLFLMVFPLWAIWVGIGAGWLVARGSTILARNSREPTAPGAVSESCESVGNTTGAVGSRLFAYNVKCTAVAIFMLLQAVGLLIYCPCHLSYYNLLVGGLAGAEKLGFEATYWGDAVREPMLAEAARLSPGGQILFAPNLAPFQATATEMCSPALHNAHVQLLGWDASKPAAANSCKYAVVYHRRADLAETNRLLERGKVVQEYSQQGVWLSRLVRLPPPPRSIPGE